jgi:ABC-2 type transport system permease protein
VAFIVGFLVSAVLSFIYSLQLFVPVFLSPLVQFVSVSSHLDNMARGVIDSRDVIYYLSATIGGLFLAVRLLARQHA